MLAAEVLVPVLEPHTTLNALSRLLFQGSELPHTIDVPLTSAAPQTIDALHTIDDPQTTEFEATLEFPYTSETTPVCGL